VLRVFLPFVRRYWRGFVPALVGVVGMSLVGLLKWWPLKFLIDDVLHVGEDGVDPEGSLALIAGISAAIVGIAALQALFSYLKDFFLVATSQRVAFSVRRALFAHVQRLSLAFHDRARTGDVMTRLGGDVQSVQSMITDKLLVDGVTSVVQFVGMLIVMLVFDWRLALVALAWTPIVIVMSSYFRRRIKSEERLVRLREGTTASITQETMSSIRTVKAFGRERETVERYAEEAGIVMEASVRVARLEARFSLAVSVVTAAGLAAFVFFGAYRVIDGALSAGTFVVFIGYMRDMQSPLNTLSRLWAKLAKVMVRGERILELLREKPAVEERPHARSAPRFEGRIRFENVSFAYEPGRPALRDVHLAIEPGEVVAVAGPTGAGKSTLANLLLRLYDPSSGAVLIDGHDIRDYKVDSLVEQIGVVLQESLLFQTTIRENIAYGKPKASPHEIEEAARLAYCDEFVSRLPHGLDTIVGERGTTLSGGQRQRIAIARALVRRAPILILDEPTTGLDAESEETVMRALERLMEGRTTLLIAHKLSTVRRADRIVVLREGRIVEQGSHAELVQADGPYARAFRLQSADLDAAAPAGG
jgi:ABC-type multidrug transport system fused ATPase/permease subunit